MPEITRIAMWSGPRNISTALMRSWENRSDTDVLDEPFYAYYLNQTQVKHPHFEEILQAQSSDYDEVANFLSKGSWHAPIQYQKHMTHHMLPGRALGWCRGMLHCFLIRHPAEVVNSYTNSRGLCTVNDIGIIRQFELYETLSGMTGQTLPILDAHDVLSNPRGVLSRLCELWGLDFDERMLCWPPGRRASDGVWAKHWYANVERSTGFGNQPSRKLNLNPAQQAVVDEVMPYFRAMHAARLRCADGATV